MSRTAASLGLRLKVSAKGFLYVFKRPQYVGGAIIGTFIAANLVIWSLNLELAQYVITEASIPISEKLNFFSSSVRDIFTTYESAQAFGIALFSVLFGINIAMLVYVLINSGLRKAAKKSGASGAGLVVAVVAGGCIACGTSLLAPIAITLGVTSGTFLREAAFWLNWISSILILFSIYHLGLMVASIKTN